MLLMLVVVMVGGVGQGGVVTRVDLMVMLLMVARTATTAVPVHVGTGHLFSYLSQI